MLHPFVCRVFVVKADRILLREGKINQSSSEDAVVSQQFTQYTSQWRHAGQDYLVIWGCILVQELKLQIHNTFILAQLYVIYDTQKFSFLLCPL